MNTNPHDQPERPRILTPIYDAIPDELKERPQCVVFRYEWDERKNDWNKAPRTPRTGRLASTTDPTTWGTFNEARAAVERGDYDGIGFVFTKDDPYAGVDLDHCRDPQTGILQQWARQIVDDIPGYWEVSPRGEGIKAIVKATMRPNSRHKTPSVEMYDQGRYFTVTAHRVPHTVGAIMERQAAFDTLYRATFPEAGANKDRKTGPTPGATLDDREIIERATRAANGAKFARLWAGDTSGHGGDDSVAEMALCGMIAFWTGPNAARIDRIFRQSDLMRAKWDDKRPGGTYGSDTIAKVLASRTEYYTAERASRMSGDDFKEQADAPEDEQDGTKGEEDDPRRGAFRLISIDEILDMPAPEWLTDNIFQRNTLASVVAEEASFKSFAMLELGLCVATGREWFGREVKQGPVVYVCAEGIGGLGPRIKAWKIARGVASSPKDFYVIKNPIQLLDHAIMDIVRETIAAMETPPALVIVDTLARCFVGGDENSSQDMSIAVEALDTIKRSTQACVILVHHVTRGAEHGRGSTALPGGVDTVIRAKRETGSDIVTWTCKKQKDAEEFKDITMRRMVVQLTDDPHGPTSMVLNVSDPKDTPLSEKEQVVFDILADKFGAEGATSSDWERACKAGGITESTFNRARRVLILRNRARADTTGLKGGRYIAQA